MKVTKADLAIIKRIADQFSDNLINNQGEDAIKRFTENLRPIDYFNIFAAKVKQKIPSFRLREAAKRELGVCMAAYEPLKRTFGEAVMMGALPEESTSERAVSICDALGAKPIADLCRKKQQAQPKL